MKFTRLTCSLVVLTMCSPVCAQDDPFQALRQYDFQSRKSVDAIIKMVRAAGQDSAKRAPIETGLMGILNDANASFAGKQEACRFLLQIGSSRCVPALAKMLSDARLGNAARYALERNADPAAGAALRNALVRVEGPALVGVINSVGVRRDHVAVARLKQLAGFAVADVSEAAITALGKIGTPAALSALRAIPGKGLTKSTAMLTCAEQLAPSGSRADALRVFEGLSSSGNPTVVRVRALSELAVHSSPATFAIAMRFAKTADDPDLARAGARTLGSFSSTTDVQKTIAAFPQLPSPAQVALLAAWADRKESAAARVAMTALRSQDVEVRRTAIQAASEIGGPAAVPALADLATVGSDAGLARESLARMRGPGVERSILNLAESGKADARVALLTVLAERPTRASTDVMLKAARDPNGRIAAAALKTLGRTAGLTEEADLIKILVGTRDDNVRDAAQSAIVAIAQRSGDRNRVAEPLLASIGGSSPSGRAALIRVLAEGGGDRALEEIVTATGSPDAEVKSAAISALADTWSDARPLSALLQIARSDFSKSHRIQALRGYLRLTESDSGATPEQKLSRVKDAIAASERPEEKRQALGVLRNVRVPGALEIAAKSLEDPDLVAEAADAILYLAAPQKRGNTNLPAVKGIQTNIALDKLILVVKDEDVREKARKLRAAG